MEVLLPKTNCNEQSISEICATVESSNVTPEPVGICLSSARYIFVSIFGARLASRGPLRGEERQVSSNSEERTISDHKQREQLTKAQRKLVCSRDAPLSPVTNITTGACPLGVTMQHNCFCLVRHDTIATATGFGEVMHGSCCNLRATAVEFGLMHVCNHHVRP